MDASAPPAEIRERERALRAACELLSADLAFSSKLDEVLELAADVLETDYATLSRVHVDAGTYVFERVAVPPDSDLEAGETTPLEHLPSCRRVVESGETLVLADVPAAAPQLTDPVWDIRCYLGAPVTAGGSVYGTFCFFDTEPRAEAFADWQVEFFGLLADWASNALGVQQYVDDLRARTEVDAIVRDATAAAIDAPSREAIQAAVCRRLAAPDAFRGAWIGEADPDADDLAVTAAAGADATDHDASIPLARTVTRAGAPVLALETGETHVTRIGEAPAAGDPAAADGPRSVISIPVGHEGVVQCVLTVHADRADAFDDAEQAVLGHLGEAVGHAIAAVERQQLVANDRAVELSLRVRHALADAGVALDDVPRVVVDDIVRAGADAFTGYATVTPKDVAPIEALADAHPDLGALSTVASRDGAVDVELTVTGSAVFASATSAGGSVTRFVLDGEDVQVRLLVPTTVDARRVVETAREASTETDVVSKQKVTRTDAAVEQGALLADLTDRQLAALRAAYFEGYYQRPRETPGGEIADTLGVSGATFSQHRRAAEQKLLRRVFEEG